MEQDTPKRHRSISQWLAPVWESDSPVQTIGLHRTLPWPKYRRSVPGLCLSSLLHFSVLFLLVRLPLARLLSQPNPQHAEHVVYVLHPLNLADYFPKLKPPGPGGRPGQGSRPDRPPARGSTAFHPRLTIVSNPPHPDNSRQTIVQTSSPPQLKIPYEIPLPNILISATVPPPPAPRPPPLPPKPIETHVVLPPRQPAPLPAAPALALVAPAHPLPNPALEVPMPPPPAAPSEPTPPPQPPQPTATSEAKNLDELDTRRNPTAGAGLLSLSIEPAASAETVALPPGNRQGAFSISPAGGKEGSPGGVPGGDALGGGAGGNGPAGDASTGVGSGSSGGGGGSKGTPGEASSNGTAGNGVGGAGGTGTVPGASVSITGTPGSDNEGVLPSFFGATTVFPVSPPGLRRPMMVVTSGPTGGGGLQVYGVLKGKKIYTVYLPMPERNWILQYCAHDSKGAGQSPDRPAVEIQLEIPIVPPSAVEQFDFRRPPVSATDQIRQDMIILQGLIQEDGSVGELKVYKGFGAVDQAALAAFSRWKFRPAQRSNKPVSVEILVGIPVVLPIT